MTGKRRNRKRRRNSTGARSRPDRSYRLGPISISHKGHQVHVESNLGAEEIEQLLRAQANVAEAAVVGKLSDTHGEEVVAFVVAADGPLDPRDLLSVCRGQLMTYKVPSEIVVVDSLPTTVGGKVRKKELAARL